MKPRLVLLVSCLLSLAGAALAQQGPLGPDYRIRPLSDPSNDDPLDICMDHLERSRTALGLSRDDVDAVVLRDRSVSSRTGTTHLYLRQELDGIGVFGSETTVAVDAQGRVLTQGERLVRGLRARLQNRRATLSAAQAVARAAEHLSLTRSGPVVELARPGGEAQEVRFAPSGVSRDEIPAKLEYVERPDGALRLAWNLVIRTPDGRHWWNLHVDAETGDLLRKDDWIRRDSYRVFPLPLKSPDEGVHELVVASADLVASPFGWHDTNGSSGAEFNDTRGNNVFAQEDSDGNDIGGVRPSGGGSRIFDFPFDDDLQPSNYRDAATVNLFYWNNIAHDVFYRYGFDEAAGNFQQNNYGNGGNAGDPVQADAQDGLDTNNAQFGTPPDGTDPIMEMFLWEPITSPQLDVASPPAVAGSYVANRAVFGGGTAGLAGTVNQALDPANGAGPSTTDACSALTNSSFISGNIAIIDRGDCDFVDKIANAQSAGAIGAIMVNNEGNGLVTMGGLDPSITIPAVFVGQDDGEAIEMELGSGVSGTLISPAWRDSDFDNAVIVHEYGHGVSNRLTGGPSTVSCLDNLQSRGMGEGWSDWFALVFLAEAGDQPKDAIPVGAYLEGNPPSGPGIRNFPYSTDLVTNPHTFMDIQTLNQPHGIGEVWAVTLWELYWNLVEVYGFDPDLYTGTGGNNTAFQIVMDALKLQSCEPTFLEARDAVLTAEMNLTGGANQCLLWSAFAKRGMGDSATTGSSGTLVVSEAFDVPGVCTQVCGDGLLQVPELCDDSNTTPFDGCSASCRVESVQQLFGVAEGGSVAVTVEGFEVSVTTVQGETAATVLANLSAAILADPDLSALSVTAPVQGNQIAIGGDVSAFDVLDAGLDVAPIVPGLPLASLLVIAAAILASVYRTAGPVSRMAVKSNAERT